MPAKRSKKTPSRTAPRKTARGTKSKPASKKTTKKAPTRAARKPKAAKGSKTTRTTQAKPAKPSARAKTGKGTRTAAAPPTPGGFPDPNTITVQPMLAVPNVEEELRFLEAMGFQTVMKMPGPGDTIMHAVVMLNNGLIHIDPLEMPKIPGMPPIPPGPLAERVERNRTGPLGLGISIYVMVDNVEKVHKALNRQNATIVHPPTDQFWGDRTVMALDPAGYLWQFAQHVKDVPPEEMGKAMEQMMPAR